MGSDCLLVVMLVASAVIFVFANLGFEDDVDKVDPADRPDKGRGRRGAGGQPRSG